MSPDPTLYLVYGSGADTATDRLCQQFCIRIPKLRMPHLHCIHFIFNNLKFIKKVPGTVMFFKKKQKSLKRALGCCYGTFCRKGLENGFIRIHSNMQCKYVKPF
jgi:hypothetical protein